MRSLQYVNRASDIPCVLVVIEINQYLESRKGCGLVVSHFSHKSALSTVQCVGTLRERMAKVIFCILLPNTGA